MIRREPTLRDQNIPLTVNPLAHMQELPKSFVGICGANGTLSSVSRIASPEWAGLRREILANSTASSGAQCRSNQSPAEISGKRELFNEWPETFGIFGRLLRKLGVWRPPTELQKPASGGLFCNRLRPNRDQTDCLADLGGFELAHSRLRNAL
jgi:hypothetical protein